MPTTTTDRTNDHDRSYTPPPVPWWVTWCEWGLVFLFAALLGWALRVVLG